MKVLLISGGSSEEREISKRTSASVYEALLFNNHSVTVFDPALSNGFLTDPALYFLNADNGPVSSDHYIPAFSKINKGEFELAFIGLHGQFGEDGVVQSLLELKSLKYTGSGVMASALSMDKHIAKLVMQNVGGIDVPKGFCIDSNSIQSDLEEKCELITGYPVVVKPNDQGSTVGLSICTKPEEVLPAFKVASRFSSKVLFEEFIPGRELTVGIVEGWELPIVEIKPKHELYDYECKYTKGMTEYFCPADLSVQFTKEIIEAAIASFESLGCKSYGRADFRLTKEGRFSCLEMNSLPGMTATSLLPKMAEAKGYSFADLIQQIITTSLA